MRMTVPHPLGWQASLPIQMTRSPNANLRAIAVFMMMPPDRPKKGRSMGDASGTARPIPLWRLCSGLRSSPIDQCSDIAPRTAARLQRLTLQKVPSFRSRSHGRNSYRLMCLVFRCRIKSATTCICSTSSSVVSTPANLSSITSISSTRSSKSAPRSFVKCVSLVTN